MESDRRVCRKKGRSEPPYDIGFPLLLQGFDVGFEGGAVFARRFEFGLELFYEQLEAAKFIAELRHFR